MICIESRLRPKNQRLRWSHPWTWFLKLLKFACAIKPHIVNMGSGDFGEGVWSILRKLFGLNFLPFFILIAFASWLRPISGEVFEMRRWKEWMLKTRFKQQRNVLSTSPPGDLIPSHLKVLPPSKMEFFSFFKNTCYKKVTHGGMTLGVFYSWNISNKFKLQGLRFGLTDFVMKHYWQILFLASLLEI